MANNLINSCISVPDEIGQLAVTLHKQQAELLSINYGRSERPKQLIEADQNCGLCEIHGDQVEFRSLDARNQCVAIHTFQKHFVATEKISAAKLFAMAKDIWRDEIMHAEMACGRFLALAGKRLNILQAAADLINNGTQDSVFDILYMVEAVLPYLPDITVDDLCAVIVAQHSKTGSDLAVGMLFNVIERALILRPQLAWALYRQIQSDLTEATANLSAVALMALAKAGEIDAALQAALDDAESDKALHVGVALRAIACMLNECVLSPELVMRCTNVLRRKSDDADVFVRQQAIQGLARAAAIHNELLFDLLELARTFDQYVLGVLVGHLVSHIATAKEHETFPHLLEALSHLSLEVGDSIVNSFDHVLSKLLQEVKFQGLVIGCLTAWVKNNGSTKVREMESIERFYLTINGLIKLPVKLQELITEWLMSDEIKLAAACGGLISFLWVRNFRTPSFSTSVLDRLNQADLIFLCRRMLGYVFHEEALLSLIFSLLETHGASSRTYDLVHTLLCQDVGRDFLSGTLEAISTRAEFAPPRLKQMFDSAHEQLSTYMKSIEELPKLEELRMPFQLRRAILLRRARQMEKSWEEANSKSIFHQLSTQITLKAGKGCFTVRDGIVGETHYLRSFSAKESLPRRCVSDPVGYDIAGIFYRTAKQGDE